MAKKPKQGEIPGTERPKIQEVEDAASHYVDQRDERCGLSKKEADAKVALIEAMKKHGVDSYKFDGFQVIVSQKSNVKVVEEETDAEAAEELEG
jgi:hypothetical protein